MAKRRNEPTQEEIDRIARHMVEMRDWCKARFDSPSDAVRFLLKVIFFFASAESYSPTELEGHIADLRENFEHLASVVHCVPPDAQLQ